MCILLEAIGGTRGCFKFLEFAEPDFASGNDRAGDALCSEVTLFTGSVLEIGRGGGNGDIDKAEMEAE